MNAAPLVEFLTDPVLVVLGVLLTAAIAAMIRLRTLRKTLQLQVQRSEDLQEMVAAYGQTLISVQSTCIRMEDRVTEFTERNLEIQSQYAFNRSFEEASRMIRDGDDASALVASCGLSDTEAELMVRLHQQSEPSPRRQLKQASPSGSSSGDSAVTTDHTTRNDHAPDTQTTAGEIRLREALRVGQSR